MANAKHQIPLRLDVDIYRKVDALARKNGQSINKTIDNLIRHAVGDKPA